MEQICKRYKCDWKMEIVIVWKYVYSSTTMGILTDQNCLVNLSLRLGSHVFEFVGINVFFPFSFIFQAIFCFFGIIYLSPNQRKWIVIRDRVNSYIVWKRILSKLMLRIRWSHMLHGLDMFNSYNVFTIDCVSTTF